jgi:hypothetical protein
MSADQEWFEGRSTDDEQHERCYWRRVGFAIFLGIALALVSVPLYAQTFSATNEDGKLTLSKDACKLAGPWFEKWKAARWMYKGKHYDACWTVVGTRGGGQSIMVIDSDGQVSQIDARAFKPDEAV